MNQYKYHKPNNIKVMESNPDIKQTSTMKTQAIPTIEQMENGIAQPSVPITSNTYIPTQQQQKNKHMKTATLPSAINVLFEGVKQIIFRSDQKKALLS